MTSAEFDERIGAWIARASHADTFRLRQSLFEKTRYDPWPGDV
ncbi:hypothetical protein [Bradyrhizobium sp.]